MKKLTIAVVAVLLSIGAFAQITTPPQSDKKQDIKDVRHDVKDVRHDKRLRHYELKHGDKAEAKKQTKDIRADKRDLKGDAKDLRKDGVKHPIKRASKQIHRHNHK